MKLSKAQQTVVDKMREGWHLITCPFELTKQNKKPQSVRKATIDILLEKGVLYYRDDRYRLTEQYKTQPDEK